MADTSSDTHPRLRAFTEAYVRGLDNQTLFAAFTHAYDNEADLGLIGTPDEDTAYANTRVLRSEMSRRLDLLSRLEAILYRESHVRPLEDIETAAIHLAIEHYNGNVSEVVRRLDIGRSTLYRKIKKIGRK